MNALPPREKGQRAYAGGDRSVSRSRRCFPLRRLRDGREADTRPTDRTIGYYCDRLLPTFCAYAVSTCEVGGTVDECVASSRPACCQGTCQRASRPVCTVDPCAEGEEEALITSCLTAYAGTPASGDASGAGAAGAAADGASGASGEAGAAGASVLVNGLSCAAVAAGFAPVECREKFLLLSAPATADLRIAR